MSSDLTAIILKNGTHGMFRELLWRKLPVLNDGFVCLVDAMPQGEGDAAVVQAARVSYGEGTKTIRDDASLIRYLMSNRHTTPFEMVEFKFLVRVPMDCWRQWIRHRTASVNEYSTRYSEAIDSRQTTKPGEWRLQSGVNKQGSSGFLPEELNEDKGEDDEDVTDGFTLTQNEADLHHMADVVYHERLHAGIAREQARKDLPLSTYTMAYWKIDLHNLLHFLSLRLDSHAQLEIRLYAQAIAEIVKRLVPITWQAFVDYRIDAVSLSGPSLKVLEEILTSVNVETKGDLLGQAFLAFEDRKETGNVAALGKSERQKLWSFLKRCGFIPETAEIQ